MIRDELRKIICINCIRMFSDCPSKDACEILSDIINLFTGKITEEWLKELQAESAYEHKSLHKTLYEFTILGYIEKLAKAIREGLGGK